MRKQAEHRIRVAAALARPGWIWAAALAMNAPSVGLALVLGWFVFTSYEPALTAVTGILFVLALLWALLGSMSCWQLLRRFVRAGSRAR
jgi:hypothetical protein